MKKDWMIIESELDEDQIKVLNAVNDKSCIISGCARSGKSVLAMIKAQRLQREKGNNYQIIVYTKTLCNYMNAGRKELDLDNQFFYHEEWKWKKTPKTYANGKTYTVFARDNNGNKIPNKPSSDYMIVDEIQDFSKIEIQEFVDATNKYFFFFGDTAQSIYEKLKDTLPVEEINYMLPSNKRAKTFELFRNYRLPKTVARVIQYVGVDLDGFDIDTYKSKETVMPRFIHYNSFEEQIEGIARAINNSGSVSDVAILVPHNIGVKRVSDLLNKKNIDHETKYSVYKDEDGNEVYEQTTNGKENKWIRTVDDLDFTTENPKVMTYHSAKGLQFGTVFLPGVEQQTLDIMKKFWEDKGVFIKGKNLLPDEERKISEQKALYVAMTRTYRNLYVMYSGKLPFPLSEVPSDLYKTTETDTVEDI